jgi:hypothetical protein
LKTPRKKEDVLCSELADECLVYDFATNEAHCLDRGALVVWKLCDGRRTMRQLVKAASAEMGMAVDEAWVQAALDELQRASLLSSQPRFVDAARRRAFTRAALTVGAGIALPAVWSIVAPTVAEAASRSSCVPRSACMGISTVCCGTSGQAGMSCSGNNSCNGPGIGCGVCQ